MCGECEASIVIRNVVLILMFDVVMDLIAKVLLNSYVCIKVPMVLPLWWNGRRGRLKICCSQGRAGSSPARGTISIY